MDWREFFRGFLGAGTLGSRRGDQWPPPPPIPEFRDIEEDEGQNQPSPDSGRRNGARSGEGGFWGSHRFFGGMPEEDLRRNEGNEDVFGFGEFGNNRFIFGDLFSSIGEMMREMERSTQEFEHFFNGHGNFSMHPQLPTTEESHRSSKDLDGDGNVRDFVLKESESGSSRNRSRHYVEEPGNKTDKVDRNLDELYERSMLDLSDMPLPESSKHSSTSQYQNVISPLDLEPYQGHGGARSTFQRTFQIQTFGFKNGRWEGENVIEDGNGRTVTKYYEDKDGQRHETTEFFPSGSHDGRPVGPAIEESPIKDMSPYAGHGHGFSQIFERFFRPRM